MTLYSRWAPGQTLALKKDLQEQEGEGNVYIKDTIGEE